MSKLLSDLRFNEIFNTYITPHINVSGEPDFARFKEAIEAAVLEAQGKQEPVGFIETVNPRDGSFRKSLVWKKHPKPSSAWCTEYTPLYAAPVVQPGMVMCDVCGKPTMHSGSRCYGCCQIAAAEGKK